MLKNYKYTQFFLVAIHILIGFFLEIDIVAKIYGNSIFFIGLVSIILSRNRNEQVLIWSLYMICMEVLMRMTSGLIFSEFTKYAAIIYLFFGLIFDKSKRSIPVIYVIYLLLLLIGIAFVPMYDTFDKIRQEIAFNLSGPFLLGVSSIYFYKRNISINVLLKALMYSVLPVITTAVYLFIKTPNLKEVVFKSAANFTTTAGFGPNQVATIFGFSIFVIFILILLKKRVSGMLIIDIILLIYIIFRGLLTFSRGGILTAIIALIVFLIFYFLSKKNTIIDILKYTSAILVFSAAIFIYTSNVTNGILTNRYTNKSTYGDAKKDITSGRTGYFELELEAFQNNPVFGVGVGGSKYYRSEHSTRYIGSSHDELSRLLSEHGSIGILIIMILITTPILHFFKKKPIEKAFLISFYVFWLLTINHSAMRLAFTGFVYGMSLINIKFNEKNFIHR